MHLRWATKDNRNDREDGVSFPVSESIVHIRREQRKGEREQTTKAGDGGQRFMLWLVSILFSCCDFLRKVCVPDAAYSLYVSTIYAWMLMEFETMPQPIKASP